MDDEMNKEKDMDMDMDMDTGIDTPTDTDTDMYTACKKKFDNGYLIALLIWERI
jgi:hypothetical protein